MKSLEIVEKIQNDLNQCFRYGNVAKNNNDNDFYHDEWEQIKQDLKMLEKIKQRLVCQWVEKGRIVGNFGIDVASYAFKAIGEEIEEFDKICGENTIDV